MKKKIVLLSLSLVVSVVLASCSGSSSSNAAPAAGAAEKAPSITLRFCHMQNLTSPLTEIFTRFCERVKADSQGSITIEHYPASQLGNETQVVALVSTNALDIAQTAPAQGLVWDTDKRISVLACPTAFHSIEHLIKAVEHPETGKWIDELAAKTNIRVIGVVLTGERHITANKAIRTPADMKGVKFRAAMAPNMIAWCNALGTVPTTIPIGELYLALQQGVVDAQENPVPTIIAQKFQEVQKYLIKTGHTFQTAMIGFSDKKWQSLTDSQRKIIQDNAKIAQNDSFVIIPKESEEGETFLTDRGMTIIEPDKNAFYAAGGPMVDELEKKYGPEIRYAYEFVQSLDK